MRRRRRAAWLAGLMVLTNLTGCVALGDAGRGTYDLGGEVFPPNPAAIVPYFVGLGLGAIASSPLLLLTWPGALLFYPEDGEKDGKIWSSIYPATFLGTTVGALLSLPFYPFGLPFTPEDDGEGWAEVDEDDRAFEDGPPGGDAPPVPSPWLDYEAPKRDGVPIPPFEDAPPMPWEGFDRPQKLK